MADTLYKVPLPEATTDTEQDDLGTALSEQGVLQGDALVEALSSEAADLSLRGTIVFGDYYSELVATELEELADSSIENLPLFSRSGSPSRGGYYEVDSATVEPVHAGGRDVWQWELDLKKVGVGGKNGSHLRAVETSESQPDPGHEFGNDLTALVGIPASARRVRALDSLSAPTERSRPDPVDTVEGAYGELDIYDVSAIDVGGDSTALTYKIAYEQEAPLDVHVYDTRDYDSKYFEDKNGRVRRWQTAFVTDHDFEGAAVIENGLLRITIDEKMDADDTASLGVERWHPDAASEVSGSGLYGENVYGSDLYAGTRGAWMSITLRSYPEDLDTDWQPADVDLTHIGQARVAAQIEFEAVAGSNVGDVYSIDVELERGREMLEMWVPKSVNVGMPADLEALLEPFASASVVDTGVTQSLVSREEVRL